jgi:Leucine-rich repeat (LRR) protein
VCDSRIVCRSLFPVLFLPAIFQSTRKIGFESRKSFEMDLLLGQRLLTCASLAVDLQRAKEVRLLSCFDCGLDSFPEDLGAYGLECLVANQNNLCDLTPVIACRTLKRVYVSSNKLVVLSSMDSLGLLERLDLSRNLLVRLPDLPTSLERLDVHSNELTQLPPSLPANLLRFSCHSNRHLKSMGPAVGALKQLTHLNVSFCPLSSLSELPPSLESLRADSCGLSDTLNVGGLKCLRRLEVRRNKLREVCLDGCDVLMCLVIADNDLVRVPQGAGALALLASVDCSGNNNIPKE